MKHLLEHSGCREPYYTSMEFQDREDSCARSPQTLPGNQCPNEIDARTVRSDVRRILRMHESIAHKDRVMTTTDRLEVF